MTLNMLRAHRRLHSSGDARLWLAPRADGTTAVVLHFTDPGGTGHVVELTGQEEIDAIATTAGNIRDATPEHIAAQLDQAAHHIISHHTGQNRARPAVF